MVQILDEQEVEAKAKAYEEKLREEMGLKAKDVRHFEKPFERPWNKDERDSTTILFGGLTLAHEELVGEAMRGLGYNMRRLPDADNDALTIGKEYGNRASATPPITPSARWSNIFKSSETRAKRTWRTNTSSSPRVPADPAGSVCTRQSSGRPCGTQASATSGSSYSSRPEGSTE